jgi:hypothetical protein
VESTNRKYKFVSRLKDEFEQRKPSSVMKTNCVYQEMLADINGIASAFPQKVTSFLNHKLAEKWIRRGHLATSFTSLHSP